MNNKKQSKSLMEYNIILTTVVQNFIYWKDNLHKEVRGGKLLFDVRKHYKWLDESELFEYYLTIK